MTPDAAPDWWQDCTHEDLAKLSSRVFRGGFLIVDEQATSALQQLGKLARRDEKRRKEIISYAAKCLKLVSEDLVWFESVDAEIMFTSLDFSQAEVETMIETYLVRARRVIRGLEFKLGQVGYPVDGRSQRGKSPFMSKEVG